MKSERRHELQQNELAGWVGKFIEDIRPYATMILGGIVVVVVGALAWAYISGTQLAERQQGWSEFHAALDSGDTDELLLVAKKQEGTRAGYWALQTAADQEAGEGASLVFRDKELAEEKLVSARNYYKQVTAASVDDTLLSQRAWLGFAKAEESLYGLTGDGENIDNAREAYEKISTSWPESSVAKTAESRLQFLAKDDAKQFYTWLAKYDPMPPGLDGLRGGPFNGMNPPTTGDPGLQLPNELDFPGLDDFNLEGPANETTEPADETTPPADDTAESGTAPPADDTPEPDTSTPPADGNE